MLLTRLQHRFPFILGVVLGSVLWFGGDTGRWLLAFAIVLIVPGWWWQRIVPLTQVYWVGRLMLYTTIGPAMLIVLYTWAAWCDIRVPVMWVWGGLGVMTVGMLWRLRLNLNAIRLSWQHVGWGVATVGAFMAVVVTRLRHIDGLRLPPWVDGVHHALLVRVAVERAHAAWNLEPYLPVSQLMYHTGWHSVMGFVWSMAPAQLIHLGWFLLVIGQVWSVLAVVSVAGLVGYWWRSWPAVMATLIVVGLLSLMPAYYVSWGRYTLLAGMAWLPIAMVASDLVWSDSETYRWYWVVPVMVGLSMLHFVVAIMAAIWLCVMWWQRGRPTAHWLSALLIMGICMVPWGVLVLSQAQISGVGDASARTVAGNESHNAFVSSLFWSRHQWWLLPSTLVSAWWMIRQRQTRIALVVVWWALIVALANPIVVGLPYLSFFTNETWITAVYMPISLILVSMMVTHTRWWIVIVLVVICMSSTDAIMRIVRPETILTNDADMRAIEWIDAHLPDDAVVATNAATWMWRVNRGSDGGWWVLPLSGRATTTPPVLFTYADAQIASTLYTQTEQLRQIRTPAALATWLQANPAITYIYATHRGAMTPELVGAVPFVHMVYSFGDVAIYAVNQ